MDALIFLTYLAIILIVGLFCTFLARRMQIPDVLLLLIAGIILGNLHYNGHRLINFDPIFLNAISILALVMIVLDYSSRFKLKKFDTLSTNALKLSITFLMLNLVFLTLITDYAFNIDSLLLTLMFSALMSGTDPAAVLSMVKSSASKVSGLLKIESLVNTPLMVLLPFIILDIVNTIGTELMPGVIDQVVPFLQQIIVGIGSGILVAIVMLKFIKKSYSHVLSPLVLITSALIAYTLAENLKGNGVLAVTAMGLLFGNVYVRQKLELQEFSAIFARSLQILVFIFIGLVIFRNQNFSYTFEFILKSFILFIVYVIIRYFAVTLSLRKSNLSLRERIFMALNSQKGIAVAVVTFKLSVSDVPGIDLILGLILMFMFYSLITSTLAIRFFKFFIVEEEQQPPVQSRKNIKKNRMRNI